MSDQKQTMHPGEFCWNELMTNDTASAKQFYTELLGWESEDIDMKDMTYTMFRKADKEIGGMLQIPKEQSGQIPPHWMSYINVKDLEAMVEKAKSLGAEIMVPITKAGDFGRFAVVQDPTGAHFSFWQQA